MSVNFEYLPVVLEDKKVTALLKPTMLLEVIEQFTEQFPEYEGILRQTVQIFVNGELIAPERWHLCMLNTGDRVLVVPIIGCGGGGVVQIVIGAVLIAVGVLIPADPGTKAYLIKTGLIMMGASMVISGGMQLLWPMKLPSIPNISGSYASEDPVYRWDGRQIQFGVGNRIPIIYGKTYAAPQCIMQYIDTSDDGKKNYINLLLCLGYGEIDGICMENGDPDILINGQPFSNYENITWDWRPGTWAQTAMEGFRDVRVYYSSSAKVTTNLDKVYTTYADDVEEFWVHLQCPSLYKVDGANVIENRVEFHIYYARSISTSPDIYESYISLGGFDITGNSKAALNKIVKNASNLTAGKYRIKVSRISADYEDDFENFSDLYVVGFTETEYDEIAYRGLALLGVKALATEQLSGATPNVIPKVRGIKVKVPKLTYVGDVVNYNNCYWDDDAGVYKKLSDDSIVVDTGVYTGDTEKQWVQDPIWQANDLSVSTAYGLGKYTNNADADLDQLKLESRYGRRLVDDGEGNQEIQFQCDIQLSRPLSGRDAVAEILKTCRGWAFWVEDKIKMLIDRPQDPAYVFNEGNIKEGSLKINFIPNSSIPNVLDVEWDNLDDNASLNRFRLVDQEERKKNKPFKPSQLELHGVIRRGQAIRDGWFNLNCTRNRGKILQFDSAINAVHCTPGAIVTVQNDMAGWGDGGRVVRGTSDSITLDINITIEANKTYRVGYILSTGVIEKKTVTNSAGTHNTLTIDGAWSEVPARYGIWIFGERDAEGKDFRVTTITRKNIGEVTLSVLEYNRTVYGHYSSIGRAEVISTLPTRHGMAGDVESLQLTALMIQVGFTISFNIPKNDFSFYDAFVEISPDGVYYRHIYTASGDASFDIIQDVEPYGTYYVRVYSRNRDGLKSLVPVETSITLDNLNIQPFVPTKLEIKGQGNDTVFNSRNCEFEWTETTPLGGELFEFGGGRLGYGVVGSTTQSYEIAILVNGVEIGDRRYTENTFFIYTLEQNIADNGGTSASSFEIRVWSIDRFGNRSAAYAKLGVSNGVPTLIGLAAVAEEDAVRFNWDKNEDTDLLGYKYRLQIHEY